MSLSETELTYLMAYVDGQVDDDEIPEVLALLERSEEARQVVAQQAAVGDWIRSSADTHAAKAGADGIAATVDAALQKLGGGKVIELEKERARLALNRQRVREFGAIFAVAAIAAGFLLLPTRASNVEPVAVAPVAPTSSQARSPKPASSVASASPSASGAAVATGESDLDSVDVQSVDSPAHPFSIFYVPAATGLNAHSSSVVVWIGEEPTTP